MAKNEKHVVPHEGKWAVRSSGASRVGSIHDTQQAAISAAVRGAKSAGAEVVIHGRDGRIRDKDSYGKDSCPPRDMRH